MSLDAAKAFLKRMESDAAFKAKILATEDVSERLKLINAAGFDCTAQEIGTLATELSEDQLDTISAGQKLPYSEFNFTFN